MPFRFSYKKIFCLFLVRRLFERISPDNILTVVPTHRNVLLAEAVKRIGLAERTGRGIDKIYTVMLRSGHAIPDYSASTNASVVLRLNSTELDENYIKMIVSEESRLQKVMPLDALIVLSVLKAERRTSISRLSAAIQKTISDARSVVEWLIELGMVDGVGNGSARRYMLSAKVILLLIIKQATLGSVIGTRYRRVN